MSSSAELDRYAQGLERLSAEVLTRLAKIHDFDNKIHMITKRTDRLIDEYFKGDFPSEAKKAERMAYIESLFAKTRRYALAKETLAKEMFDLVSKSAHRLDFHLMRYHGEIQSRAEIIRNAVDHHSEERRLERDKKEARDRKRQAARERKKKKDKEKEEDEAAELHKDKSKNSQSDEANEAVDTEAMDINNTSYTSEDSSFAINSSMNNMHINEERQSSCAEKKSSSRVYEEKKSRITGGQSDRSSSTSPDHSSKEKISSRESSNKKPSSSPSSTHNDKKSTSSKSAGNKKPPSDSDSSDESSDDSHDVEKKQSTSSKSASNKKPSSDHVSRDESSVNNHDAKDKKLTGPLSEKKSVEKNELKKSKSSNSSSRKSVDTSSAGLKKADSSANRVKSSSDQKPSSKSKSQKENKDTKKRRKVEKSTISDEKLVKKRKLSDSSAEEEFDIPPDPDEPVYCYCQKVSYGDMVACDNDECGILWFHFGCVGLKSSPPGKWYCIECAKKRRNSGKSVR